MKSSSHRKALQSFDSILGIATSIEGNLHVNESLRIDGRLKGNIKQEPGESRWIIVSSSAEIQGDIHAQNVSITGKVIGNIFASDTIELMNGCDVRGNITHKSLTVEPGALVFGQLIAINDAQENNA